MGVHQPRIVESVAILAQDILVHSRSLSANMANLTQATKYAPGHVPAFAYTYDPNASGGRFRVHSGEFASFDVVEGSLKIHEQLLREAEANLREAQANVRRAEADVLHLETILKEHAAHKQEQYKNKQIDRAGKKTAAKAKAKANSKGLDSSPELCSGPPSPSP